MSALSGCSIAVNGTFPGYTQAKLRALITGSGAKFEASGVTDTCTHLITPSQGLGSTGEKCHSAWVKGIQIVSLEWLTDSVKEGKRLDEKAYSHKYPMDEEPGGGDHQADSNQSDGKKRKKGMPVEPKEKLIKKPRGKRDEEPKDVVKVAKKIVPVDDACPLKFSHNVYIDVSGTPFDASLNQTNIGQNNNKFYNVQLLESRNDASYATWTRWGRVGESGQNALFDNQTLEGARKIFETKFQAKSGLKWENRHDTPKAKKYTLIEKNYMDEPEDDEPEDDKPERKPTPDSKLSPELQSLIQLIFNPGHMASSMAAMRYDANKLPLGKLSKKTLSQGFAALKDLSDILASPALAQSKYRKPLEEVLNDLTSKYYTVIPHDFGRQRPPVIRTEEILKKEIDLVETLGDMEIANEIMKDAEYPVDADGNPTHPLDSQFKSLDLEEATLVDKSTVEFTELEKYLQKSQKAYRAAKLVEVFRIRRPGEAKRFEEGGYTADKVKTHNVNDSRKLLWHGSRSTNFGGILSQGLRIAPPEAPVNGYAFGKGIYLADLASKSCEYVYPHTSGNQGLLLLCEAQLGDPVYERYDHDSNAASTSKKNGSLSTWAQGKTQPTGWKDAGAISEELRGVMMPDVDAGLMNPANMPPSAWIPDNEYIVYSVAQVKLRYLFRVSFL